MQLKFIGLGRIGTGMVERLRRHGHKVVGFDVALFARFTSRQDDSPAMRLVAALRQHFGGQRHLDDAVPQAPGPGQCHPAVAAQTHGEHVLSTLAVLGARGDLTGRYLLPALVRLAAAGDLPSKMRIVAVDRAAGDDASFRAQARERLDRHLPDRDVRRLSEELLERVCYRQADVTSAEELGGALRGLPAPLAVYLALPNAVFRATVDALTRIGLPERTTLVLEKPFGTGLADARELNDTIRRSFGEQDVFRIDHFLAKQTVLDLLGLRFANRLFEPVWNSVHIERVGIVWDESLGLEGRAGYYDHAGALRDMIQNHLLQLLALVAMEPPTSLNERDLRDRKNDVLRAVTAPTPHQMASATRRARYTAGRAGGHDMPAYVDEDGVDPSRGTETYAEVTLRVQNWRWAGIPFRLRTGKALSGERREIALHFRPIPHHPFDDRSTPDVLRFSLEPDRIALEINLNGAGDPFDLERATLAATFPQQQLPPYSLLLREIMGRDPTLSIRGDEAEESWRIVEPIVEAWATDEVPLLEYRAGSSGPPALAGPPAGARCHARSGRQDAGNGRGWGR